MDRGGLRDDEWDRIKDFLPGREGYVGGTAPDNRQFVDAVLRFGQFFSPKTTFRANVDQSNRCIWLDEGLSALANLACAWTYCNNVELRSKSAISISISRHRAR